MSGDIRLEFTVTKKDFIEIPSEVMYPSEYTSEGKMFMLLLTKDGHNYERLCEDAYSGDEHRVRHAAERLNHYYKMAQAAVDLMRSTPVEN